MKKTLTALGAMLAVAPAALAQTAAAPEDMGMASMIPSLVLMVAMIALFYFMLIRPQKKKDKAVKDMLSALKKGDRICTIGGIYGNIVDLKEDTITIAVGKQKAEMVIARWAIRSVEDAPLENDTELTA